MSDRVKIENSSSSSGSFNMAYVREFPGTLVMLAIAKINPNWDIVKQEEVLYENETAEDNSYRNSILLNEARQDAIVVAYSKAKKEVNIKSSKLVVTLIDSSAQTGLKIGDEIFEVDGVKVDSLNDVRAIVQSKKVDDILIVTGKRDNKDLNEKAIVYEEEGWKFIGVGASLIREITTKPELQLDFKKSESGPSGGLISALAIYDALIDKDLTRGLKILGTGTIDVDGNVGPVGGIKYKLAGAVRQKGDIFLVPAGKNYEEAINLAKKFSYDIEIISIKTFDEAVEYLLK